MKHSFLDQYSNRDSIIHRLDPRSKLLVALAFIATIALMPVSSWLVYGMYFIIIATLILLSRVPPLFVFRRSLVIIPFVLLVAVFIPFFKEGELAFVFDIWRWHLSVTHNGLELLWSILAKSWLSILSLILLTSTTGFASLLKGLERLRMPRVMVMLLSFMYRYIFLLTDETMRMKQARNSRNFGSGRLRQISTVGNMIGTLFIRSYERGERIYAAMVSRGFDGHSRTLDRLRFNRTDIYFITSMMLILGIINLFNLFYKGELL
ncbi:MAG: cobalt ECF transporter T component CbiQ [Dehalococcoidia bacterium]|nr:MAG: cobalt ECF transporter T component CbiQ [Dehalococcoidia bacterium]